MNYTIAAIPTVYRGRQYRSRLEARWAAFFDQLKWSHEYEPYDLGVWSPDFMLVSPYGGEVLVEVKPITEFNPDVAKKMMAAVVERGLAGNATLMLLGTSPVATKAGVRVGWIGHVDEQAGNTIWSEAVIAWFLHPDRPEIVADAMFCDTEEPSSGWSGVLTYYFASNMWRDARPYRTHTMELWAAASNAVQWAGRSS